MDFDFNMDTMPGKAGETVQPVVPFQNGGEWHVEGLPPEHQNARDLAENTGLIAGVTKLLEQTQRAGPRKCEEAMVTEVLAPPEYEGSVMGRLIDDDSEPAEAVYDRCREKGQATLDTFQEDRPAEQMVCVELQNARDGMRKALATAADLSFDASASKTVIQSLLERLEALAPDTPQELGFGSLNDHIRAVMHDVVSKGVEEYFLVKDTHAKEVKELMDASEREKAKLGTIQARQRTLVELATLASVGDETAQYNALRAELQINGETPQDVYVKAAMARQEVDKQVAEQRAVVLEASRKLIEATEAAGETSTGAQTASLEGKKQQALALAEQQLDGYRTKLGQVRSSLATLFSEKKKLEAERRERGIDAAKRRESCGQNLTAKCRQLAEYDRELLRLMNARVQLDHSIRTTLHQNRIAERDFKVKDGALSKNLDTNLECTQSLGKFEPALEQSMATVAKVRDAAREFIDGIKSNVDIDIRAHKRDANSQAVAALENYCKAKRAYLKRYFQAANLHQLEGIKLDHIGINLKSATRMEHWDEVVELGRQQRELRARIEKHEAVQDDQQEAWTALDRTIEHALIRLGQLYAVGAPDDEHSQVLKRRVEDCVRVRPPDHPKDDLYRQVRAEVAKEMQEQIEDRRDELQVLDRLTAAHAEEQAKIAMLEDRRAAGTVEEDRRGTGQVVPGGPEEGVQEGVPPSGKAARVRKPPVLKPRGKGKAKSSPRRSG